jgi:hypothetical protein
MVFGLLGINNFGRNAHGCSSWGNVYEYHRVGSDIRVIANGDIAKEFGSGSHVNPLTQFWGIERTIQVTISHRHSLADNTIVADYTIAMNHNTTLVFDDYAATELSAIRQFNSISVSDFAK